MMLHAERVSFAYRADAPLVVDEVSVTVGGGDMVGILGPNGSGKTTLLKMLSGTLTASAGAIHFGGRPLHEWKRRDLARRIALVPQETHAPFDFTVLDIVLMGRFPHLGTFALEGPDDLAIARQALAATATSAFEHRPFATLSGGEKQRVVIASALAQSPELLLLDEPTASLDLGHQLDVQLLLAGLNRDRGVTMVLSTHDLNLAAALCTDLILLRGGRVLAQGKTEDVLTVEAVRALYGVEADIQRHPAAGHLTVTPLSRVP
jgi:iron complex transport system ATP-binding protein